MRVGHLHCSVYLAFIGLCRNQVVCDTFKHYLGQGFKDCRSHSRAQDWVDVLFKRSTAGFFAGPLSVAIPRVVGSAM